LSARRGLTRSGKRFYRREPRSRPHSIEKMNEREPIAEELFEEALELSPEQRSAFLEKACRDSPELRRSVEALLDENDRLRDSLAEPLFRATETLWEGATAANGSGF